MRDSCIWCFNADILNFKYFICTPRKKKNEDTHSCGINGIAEKKGLAGYHFNRTVRVQWFFLVIFIWGFYVCASWFKGTLNHLGWGVVDYAFNQVAGLGKVAGRATRASALGPRMFCLSFESVLLKKKEPKAIFTSIWGEINSDQDVREGGRVSSNAPDYLCFKFTVGFSAFSWCTRVY